MKNVYIQFRQDEGNTSLDIPNVTCEDNIKMAFTEGENEAVKWVQLAQDIL
jgi:hypothetical protein